ncbi:hypothetical protein Vadar_000381 [Vaccinium darrowii]|uniref:Uncharacterized protein n=1 Tax=Vaccinium darrowii TaxID=229202 RepID=A0ACB7YB78_9ERIC|nr:hypothetical protein Vadar_000381 [Vaccinium darrowii]
MLSAEQNRLILGIVGDVTSLALFLSPFPTVYEIWKKKAVEDFKPDPNIAMVMNCIFWVFYGITTPGNITVIIVNSIGLALALSYLAVFMFYCKPQRCKILLYLGAEVVLTAVIVCVTLLVLHDEKHRSILVGVCSVAFGLILYSSPITIMTGNGLGAMCSLSQLALYWWYYGTPESRASREKNKKISNGCWGRRSTDIESNKPSKPEVQLSQV